jgi:hypothetical protein
VDGPGASLGVGVGLACLDGRPRRFGRAGAPYAVGAAAVAPWAVAGFLFAVKINI